jgi:hypothetical protein
MRDRSNSRKLTDILLDDAQTLFMTSAPVIRYPIAAALAAVSGYMFLHSPPFEMSYALAYAMIAAVYAWELSAGLLLMAVIFGVFKFLASLPLIAAIIVVVVVAVFIGF